jgi:hypothetical protein
MSVATGKKETEKVKFVKWSPQNWIKCEKSVVNGVAGVAMSHAIILSKFIDGKFYLKGTPEGVIWTFLICPRMK